MSGIYALMDTLLPFEWLHYTFMKNALIAILLLTPLFGMLGTMAVDNKMAFFSDALGHSALTGIAIGVVLGWQSQMSAMLLFGILWAVLITFVKHHSKMSADTIISVFSSTSIALGLVVLSRGGAFAKYSSVLVSDVLSVAQSDLLALLLAQVLGLAKPPRAIESYDISNWGDGSSVCGMVTFKDGKPYKAGYRKFKMKTVAGTDDYASLAETVSRRAAEYEKYAELAQKGEPCSNWFGQKPDLLLMDGGRGQVSAAKDALAGTALADVPLYGMVKDDHHRTRAIVDSDGREIAINMNRGTFTFITAIQDETHRFANAYRKQQMKQKSYSSTLTEIPGIGPKTAKALMAQFKSVGAVKEATPDQLENTPGVGKQTAQIIYAYFHE